MTNPTEIETFRKEIESEPEITTLIDDVAEDAEFREATDGTRHADPLTFGLATVAVAALWKLVSIGLQELRNIREEAAAGRRMELIRELQEMGYGRQAPFILSRMIKDLRERPEDDPVLKKLRQIHIGD